jgi:hypothetical protein
MLLTVGCGPAPAKAPPAEALALPSDTLTAPWSNLPRGAWLGGNRWVLVASDWDEAAVADFGAHTLTPVGAGTRGRPEHPVSVFTSSDTLYLTDWGGRTTVWVGNRLIDSIPSAAAIRGAAPRARDAAGQLYYEVRRSPGRDGSGNRDSAAVVRAPRDLSRFDTLARLAPVDGREMERENSRRFERQVFSGDDLWGVWRDGTIWIARLLRNNLWTIESGGRMTKGPELPDPVFEVTQVDRERYLQGFPSEVRPKETDLPFALVFPPFVAAFQAPGETVWLEKSKPALDTVRYLHVLDRRGDLLRLLRLHSQGRVLAVGDSTFLLAEQYEKGIRLMSVRIPISPPAAAP